MSPVDGPVTASMDPWLLLELGGEKLLFGFAAHHPLTGGLSWMRSSPLVELDEAAGRARTESGRVYALGRRAAAGELDEEARTAMRLLASEFLGVGPHTAEDVDDARWITARKAARHLGAEPPPRGDPDAVERFLRGNEARYAALRAGWDAAMTLSPGRRMTVDDFLAWQETEPDTFELVEGRPVRVPEEQQALRRTGQAFAAASLALGQGPDLEWLANPSPHFGGGPPLLAAAEGWEGLAEVLRGLRDMAAIAGALLAVADPDEPDRRGPGWAPTRPGESINDMLRRAERLAAVERTRRGGGGALGAAEDGGPGMPGPDPGRARAVGGGPRRPPPDSAVPGIGQESGRRGEPGRAREPRHGGRPKPQASQDLGRTLMADGEGRDAAADRRATIHFWCWLAQSGLAKAAAAARDTAHGVAYASAAAELERLLAEVEDAAARAGKPLVRPPLWEPPPE